MNARIAAATLPRRTPRLVVMIATAVFLSAVSFQSAWAQIAPTLGDAQPFAVLAASTVTNTGPTVITGNVGIDAGTAVTGFPPGLVNAGIITGPGGAAALAQAANLIAFGALNGQACTTTFLVPTNLGTMNLGPGVYCAPVFSIALGQTLTLSGPSNGVWIFKATLSTVITGSGSSVVMAAGGANAGQNCNVFWSVASSATLGTGTTFIGNILALTSIGLDTGATLSGRALAQTGAVTLDSNTIGITACAVTPPLNPPALSKAFSPATINVNGTSVLTITLSNPNTTAATLTANLIDTLPLGVVIANPTGASTTCGGSGVVAATSGGNTVTLPTGRIIPANGSCTVTVNVTSAGAGTYHNSLAIGALQTSNGNNVLPAVADLLVVAPNVPAAPMLVKSFSPATITAGGVSTLTITLSNTNNTIAQLIAPLVDTLPSGVFVAAGTRTNTCGLLTTLTAITGATTVTLAAVGNSIPANGFCTVTVPVTAPVAGSYFNVLLAGALQTNLGVNAAPAAATLVVTPIIVPVCVTGPPSVGLYVINAGPPKVVVLKATPFAPGGAIMSIVVIASTNLAPVYFSLSPLGTSPFTVIPTGGLTVPVYIFAPKANQSLGSVIGVQVFDRCANVKFDPLDTTVYPGKRQTITGVARAESLVQIINDNLDAMTITVNGRRVVVKELRRHETRIVDISRAMVLPDNADGSGNNTITLEARGPKGSSASVTVYPPPG